MTNTAWRVFRTHRSWKLAIAFIRVGGTELLDCFNEK